MVAGVSSVRSLSGSMSVQERTDRGRGEAISSSDYEGKRVADVYGKLPERGRHAIAKRDGGQ